MTRSTINETIGNIGHSQKLGLIHIHQCNFVTKEILINICQVLKICDQIPATVKKGSRLLEETVVRQYLDQ